MGFLKICFGEQMKFRSEIGEHCFVKITHRILEFARRIQLNGI